MNSYIPPLSNKQTEDKVLLKYQSFFLNRERLHICKDCFDFKLKENLCILLKAHTAPSCFTSIFELPQSFLLPLNPLSTSRNQLKLSLPAHTTAGQ